MKRIDFEDLDFDYEKGIYIFNDTAFSGIAYEILEDKQLNEVMILEGAKNGISREWFPNGKIKMEEHFFNNSYHGVVTIWDEDGFKIEENVYELGILTRKWKYKKDKLIDQFEINSSNDKYESLLIKRKRFYSNYGS